MPCRMMRDSLTGIMRPLLTRAYLFAYFNTKATGGVVKFGPVALLDSY